LPDLRRACTYPTTQIAMDNGVVINVFEMPDDIAQWTKGPLTISPQVGSLVRAGGFLLAETFVAAVRSIRHQIIVAAQNALDVVCGTSRGVGISSARGQYTQGPIIFSAPIRDAIDGDVLNVMTTGLLSDFCQRPPPQILHRK
jgi:hypothetical protein